MIIRDERTGTRDGGSWRGRKKGRKIHETDRWERGTTRQREREREGEGRSVLCKMEEVQKRKLFSNEALKLLHYNIHFFPVVNLRLE